MRTKTKINLEVKYHWLTPHKATSNHKLSTEVIIKNLYHRLTFSLQGRKNR